MLAEAPLPAEEVFEEMMFHHANHLFEDRGWWPGFFHGILPLLLLLVLIGVGVWVAVRLTSGRPVREVASAPAPPTAGRDLAVEEVRLRYARGELTREEFLQRSTDLGGTTPGSPGA